LGDLGIDRRIIFKRIFKKLVGRAWTVLSGSEQELASCCGDCGNETGGS
jgi:hypothetical protein